MPNNPTHCCTLVATSLLLSGCWGKDGPDFNHGDGELEFDTADPHCDLAEWSWSGTVLEDPVTCLAWSPKSEELTWHATVNSDEAESGGCTADCDEETLAYCDDLGALDGYNQWRVPNIDTLEAMALRAPPFDEKEGEDALEGDLWSRNTGEQALSLAWTAELSQPGFTVLLDKESAAHVRCVTNIGAR